MTEEDPPKKIVSVQFYKESNGNEPVRKWLKSLDEVDRKSIGEDIKTVEYGWPKGMPLVKNLKGGLWEVRSRITNGIARVFFTLNQGMMILLHGVIKKSRTVEKEISIARERAKKFDTKR